MFCDKLTIILCFLLVGTHTKEQVSSKCFGQTCQVKQQRRQENSICSQAIIISDSVIQLGRCKKYLFTLPLLNSLQHKNELIEKVFRNLMFRSKNIWNHESDVLTRIYSQIRIQVTQILAIKMQEKYSTQKLKVDFIQGSLKSSEQDQILFFGRNQNTQSIHKNSELAPINLDFQHLLAKSNMLILFNLIQAIQESAEPSYTLYLSKHYEQPSFLYFDQNQIPSSIIDNSLVIKVRNNNSYQLKISSFTMNPLSFFESKNIFPNLAIISSATQYFTISQNLYDFLINNYFKSCSKQQVLECTCNYLDSMPKFKLQFGSININLIPEAYLNLLPDGQCTFNFHVNKNLDDHVIEVGSLLFYSLLQNNQANQQGDQVDLIFIDFTFFEVSMYILLVTIILFSILSGVMLWKYRVIKPEKYPSRFYQISLSSRFLDNS